MLLVCLAWKTSLCVSPANSPTTKAQLYNLQQHETRQTFRLRRTGCPNWSLHMLCTSTQEGQGSPLRSCFLDVRGRKLFPHSEDASSDLQLRWRADVFFQKVLPGITHTWRPKILPFHQLKIFSEETFPDVPEAGSQAARP